MWRDFTDLLRARGRALDDIGVSDTALDRDSAEHALRILEGLRAAILGGDVYLLRGQSLASTYDSWHCDQQPNESSADFATRSLNETRAYLRRYPNVDAWFTLVLRDRPFETTIDDSEI